MYAAVTASLFLPERGSGLAMVAVVVVVSFPKALSSGGLTMAMLFSGGFDE